MTMQPAALLQRGAAVVVLVAAAEATYPLSYTSCGVNHTVNRTPTKVVTMNQGATEFLLAMGLQGVMAGTAYLDDSIWPRYAAAYSAIPVLSAGYPNETAIMAVGPDFIIGSYRSAFREKVCTSSCRGIFSNSTVGPCAGAGSDFFPSGSNATTSYSTCRPQLHAAGIGTWLEPVSCEDASLKPQGGATEDTVYAAIRQIGKIFNVPSVAEQLVSEIRSDFATAERTVQSSGHSIKAIWLDCVGRCCKDANGNPDPKQWFVGGGTGAPNLIMKESGLTNVFASRSGSWVCVTVSDVLAADPDVVIVVDASWDTALSKIDFLHNHSDFCKARFTKRADYIKIPFSASTLGPRNGAAALDMVSAAIHVTKGSTTMNFQSGVEFFDPNLLATRTASLRCPVDLANVPYSASFRAPAPAPSPSSDDDDALPVWAIALMVVFGLLFVGVLAVVVVMYLREKKGKPIFAAPLMAAGQPQAAGEGEVVGKGAEI